MKGLSSCQRVFSVYTAVQGISLREQPQLKAEVYDTMSYNICDTLAVTCPHLYVSAILMLIFGISSSVFRFNYHIYIYDLYIYIYLYLFIYVNETRVQNKIRS